MMRSLLISMTTPKNLANAHLYGQDYSVFDLNTETPKKDADSNRDLVVQAIKHIDYELEKIIININSFSNAYWQEDISDLFSVGVKYFSFVLDSKEELKKLISFVEEIEKGKVEEEGKIKFVCSIGNPELIMNIQEIVSMTDRIFAIIFNKKEFTKYIKTEDYKNNKNFLLAKMMLVMGTATKNIYCIDSSFEDLSDEDGFVKETKENMQLGFNGKICIHPLQVRIVNNIYKSNNYYGD